ncbi:insulinase family protein [Myxococcota bacterium]|nr:insulinase family protein [Myxococcota bacterium]
MIRAWALSLALVLAASAGEAGPGPAAVPPPVASAPPLQIPAPQALSLPDGTAVWLLPRPGSPVSFVSLSLPGGLSTAEDPAALGLAASLLEEGVGGRDAPRLSAAAWQEAVQREGARVHVATSALRTRVEIEALAGREAPALALAVRALVQPALPRRALRVARRAAVRDARDAWLAPGRLHERAIQQTLYPPGHPLAAPAGARALARVGRGDARRAWQAQLAAGAPSVVVVGPLPPEELLPLLSAALAPLPGPRGPVAPPAAMPPPQVGPRRVLVDAPGATRVTVSALVPVAGVGDPRQPGLELLVRALAADFDSRLSRRLREERGWTYGVHGGLRLWPGHGWIEVRVSVDPEVLVPTLELVEQELVGLVSQPPDGAELDRVRSGLRREAAARLWEEADLAQGLSARQAWGQPPGAQGDEVREALALSAPALAGVAAALAVDQVTWVLTGDRAWVEPVLEESGLALDAVRSGPRGMDGWGPPPL